LNLYAVDGAVETIDIGLSLATRSVPHVARLIELKLDALPAMLTAMEDTGFGFEAIGLAVTRAEPMPARQIESDIDRHPEMRAQQAFEGDDIERCAGLIDAFRQRLGPDRVRVFEAVASHIPERAERLTEIDDETFSGEGNWTIAAEQTRPLLLLPQAEPAEVTALVPDGPPRRLRWRGVTYDIAGVARAGRPMGLSRDYYLVEDEAGHRFWLYREGLYGRETAAARWFVHGLFA
jgi:protein ImuB